MSDSSGTLYNKDAILEYLLPSDDPAVESLKADQQKIMKDRIKGLKDMVEVKFQVEEPAESGRTGSPSAQKWICPITNKTLGPAVKAVYIVPCGHAFAEVALKEVAETKCLQVSSIYPRFASFLTCSSVLNHIQLRTSSVSYLSLNRRRIDSQSERSH